MKDTHKKAFSALRIVFGVVWLVDAYLKWNSAFLNGLLGYLQSALQGQPPVIAAWITIWIKIVSINPHLFAILIALIETFLALALLFGFFTRTAIIVGIILTALIWTTAEGFGGPYVVGSTDIGSAIIYLILFASLWFGECWQYYSVDTAKNKRVVMTICGIVLALAALIAFVFYTHPFSISQMVILNPQGTIALQERTIMIAAVSLMLVLVIPTFIFTIVVARKYSVKNQANDSTQLNQEAPLPDQKSNRVVIVMWWILPAIIIFFLSVITWTGAHDLDPSQPILSNVPPITIQVVAMQWKWLFIYPSEGIATVNFLEIPVNTPIHFVLTSDDAPMNSFWVPQLSGQIYTMTGMSTQLNLMATGLGDFSGRGAEMSGQGFSGMTFTVNSVSQTDFSQWVSSVQQSPNILNQAAYQALLVPSENVATTTYSNVASGLYDTIVMKYMAAPASATSTGSMGNMNMGTMDMNGMGMNNNQ